MKMKLWLLRPIDEDSDESLWHPWYDRTFGFVVRAQDTVVARVWAASRHGDEGGKAWLDDTQTSCEELTSAGDGGILLIDYRNA